MGVWVLRLEINDELAYIGRETAHLVRRRSPLHYRSFPEIIIPSSDPEQAETSLANDKNNPVDSKWQVHLTL